MLLTAVFGVKAQEVEVAAEHVTSSTLKDGDGNNYGSGSLMRYKLKYTQPLSVKFDQYHRPTIWTATLGCKYNVWDNNIQPEAYVPDKVINLSARVMHIRPVGKRWTMMAMLGVNFNSVPKDLAFNKIIVNGACIFMHKMNKELTLGVGGAVLTSYGAPIVLPGFYVRWYRPGDWEFDFTCYGLANATVTKHFGKKFKLAGTLLDMEGTSSILRRDGKGYIFSSMMMRSYLTPTLQLGKKSTLWLNAGTVFSRTARLHERKLSNFFKFGMGRKKFRPAVYLSVGYKQKF